MQNRFYENDYDEAFKRLSDFYGNRRKVVHCVMKEVSSPNDVSEGDYQGLIDYSVVLENNFNRLSAMGDKFQTEMSNNITKVSSIGW